MAKNYDVLADSVVELIGGKDNVRFFTHCVTRLRFNVKDRSIVKMDEIKDLPGVAGAQWSGEQLQIIIGQDVGSVYELICKKHGFASEKAVEADDADAAPQQKGVKAVVNKIFDGISGSLTPLIPALIGCGMIKVILILLDMAGVPADNGTYQLLTFAGDAGFYFLPIMIGAFAAKKFGANMALGMVIGGLLIYPTFASGVSAGTAFNFLGIPVYGVSYSSTIFPIILCCAVMAPIEKFVAKHSPAILRSVLEPLGTFLVMLPLSLCLVAPAGVFLGNGITWLVETIYNNIGFLGVGVLSGLYPLLILTGMHSTLAPVCISYFTKFQYDPLIIPACYIANFGQAAAAAAVTLKSKNADVKGIAGSSALTAFLAGVTEPALFGVNFRYRKPLIASVIGGFVGGCYAGLMGCKLVAMSGLGVFALAGFLSSDIMNFVNYVIAVVIAMVVTFAITFVTFKDEA